MTEYKLLEASSADELGELVTEALKDGFGTIGSPIITELFGVPTYAQAVIKFESL